MGLWMRWVSGERATEPFYSNLNSEGYNSAVPTGERASHAPVRHLPLLVEVPLGNWALDVRP